MAHFAELSNFNIVLQVIVVDNSKLLAHDGVESEETGIQFCKKLYGDHTRWVQTSYNANFRKNFAGIGFFYDSDKDAFIPPRPYPSWILDTDTCQWAPPVQYPADSKFYIWDETTVSWIETI